MAEYETICFFDKVSISDNFIINKNSLLDKHNNKNYKFNQIINNLSKYEVYYYQIIKILKKNISNQIYSKKKLCFLLFGNLFSPKYNLPNLLNNIISEFAIESFPFNFSILQIKSEQVINLMNSQEINFDEEFLSGFSKEKIYLDPIDPKYFSQATDIKDLIELQITKSQKNIYIFTIESTNHKIRLYIIDDDDTSKDKYFNPYSESNLSNTSEVSNLILYLLDDKNKNLQTYRKTPLVKLLDLDLKNANRIKSLFGFINDIRYLDLTDSIYYYLFKNNSTKKLISVETHNLKNNSDVNKLVYPKPKNLIKLPSLTINKNPLNSPIEKTIGDILNDFDKMSEFNKNNKIKNKYNTDKISSNKKQKIKSQELLTQEQVFERLQVINKFLFNSTVKNQLKLQKAHRDKSLIGETNKDLNTYLQSLMIIVLDQLKEMN